MKITYLAAAAAVAMSMSVATAQAAPMIDFDVAGAPDSGVTLNRTAGNCILAPTCITASLASGLDGTMFSLEEGQSASFDFLTFTGRGLGGLEAYDISATLAFDLPAGQSTTGSGTAGALTVLGNISAGFLNFSSGVPQLVTLGNGNKYLVDFEDGITILDGKTVTTKATVTAVNVVPLPASVLLLLAGLGGLTAFGRKKAA